MSSKGLTDSQFYMWRTLFAIAHADKVVSPGEIRFMAEALEDVPFTEGQKAILSEDIKHAQDIEEMFKGVNDVRDQALFFKYARSMVHADGDYGKEEQEIILKLQKTHLKNANLDDLVGSVKMEMEEDLPPSELNEYGRPRTFKDVVFSFRERFVKDRFR